MVRPKTVAVEAGMWKKVDRAANYPQSQHNMEMIVIAGGEDES
jgi:hypothetical protein